MTSTTATTDRRGDRPAASRVLVRISGLGLILGLFLALLIL